ncbi:hypothetical protein C8R43DRAFT_1141655 [Mycena crocata]|nr:hypothetical protein C8R43DRAFT_1141655 [Mycena crocata]
MHPTIARLAARAPTEVAVVSQPFKRSQYGLFQGKTKQYGNSVPFSLHKTRRSWLPNVQRKRLFSETLQSHLRVKLTTAALKTIKKKGGVDNYVMQTRPDILGWKGMQIRVNIRDAQKKNAAVATDAPRKVSPPKPKAAVLRAPDAKSSSVLKALGSSQTASKFIRYTRRMAAKSLGRTGFATAEETIRYMKNQKIKQDKSLPSRGTTTLPL